MMTPKAKAALEKVRTDFASAVEKLDPADYLEVCEEVMADLEGRTEAAKIEAEPDEG